MAKLNPHSDLMPYIGKRMRITKIGKDYQEHSHEGVFRGQGEILAAEQANKPPKRLLVLSEDGGNDIYFSSDDGWAIEV